jgi:hypothetical protein
MANTSLNENPERAIDYCEKYLYPLCERPEQEMIMKALNLAKEEGKLISYKLLLKNGRVTDEETIAFTSKHIEKTKNYIKSICIKYKLFYEKSV